MLLLVEVPDPQLYVGLAVDGVLLNGLPVEAQSLVAQCDDAPATVLPVLARPVRVPGALGQRRQPR